MRRWPDVGLLLGQRRTRWTNVKPTLVRRLMFAGKHVTCDTIKNHFLTVFEVRFKY